jgi:glucosamine--fructose-6-phosphate aminotransferase (isomerizing)
MCGISGYIGGRNAQKLLTGALRRMEYRGYDSAGLVTLSGEGKPTLLRAQGKVSALASIVSERENGDTVGIAHTRWATHGVPSEKNAHPHKAGDIYLVHNGIIENYKELRTELKNHRFVSQTDSEVLAALISELYDKKETLEEAVAEALKLVVGTYGIAVVSVREPGKIVVARAGSPLIIGVGEDETLIASDASALVGYTSEAIYLNDGELAVCTREGVDLQDLNATHLPQKVEKIETDLQAIQKQGYEHFLLKEIMEQPSTLGATINGRVIVEENRVQLGGLNLTPDELRAPRTTPGCSRRTT